MNNETAPPAGYYHAQSQRIRRLATEAHSIETRDQFLALAEQYDRLDQAAQRPGRQRASYRDL